MSTIYGRELIVEMAARVDWSESETVKLIEVWHGECGYIIIYTYLSSIHRERGLGTEPTTIAVVSARRKNAFLLD